MSEPRATTSSGLVEGRRSAGLQVFRGIPYAAPPLGPLRCVAPSPAPAWTGTLDASRFGGVPLQVRISGEMEIPPAAFELGGRPSEDCLYLNVWTPSTQGSRPVMVWIPGGSFVEGSGSQPWYDPSGLSERGDVVAVSLNYRLGAFGWLYLDELGGREYGAASNCGLRDQIEALRWIQENIAAFGGDPSNVTVFGQSAGAWSITSLLAAPAASGLFSGAVNHSGGEMLWDRTRATEIAEWVLDVLGITRSEISRLWDLPAEAIVDATRRAWEELGLWWPFRPVVDDDFLPPPVATIRSGAARDVRLLVGSTLDEMKLVSTVDPEAATLDDASVLARLGLGDAGQKVLDAYRAARESRGEAIDPTSLYWAIESDRLFGVPGIRVAEAQSLNQHDTYMYLTTWRSPDERLGACHSVDSALFFGTLDLPGMERFSGADAAARILSAAMQDALIAFARTGNPSHAGLPAWPRYEAEARETMLFGAEPRLESAPLGEERACWEGLL